MDEFDKNTYRICARKLRNSFTDEYRITSGIKVLDFVGSLNLLKQQILGFYWPINSEFDVKFLIRSLKKSGFQISLPVISRNKEDRKLIFRLFDDIDDLELGKFGILEPKECKIEVVPDVIFVPLLAFDLKGNRLGYGGGYYDVTIRYLKKVKKNVLKVIGIGYSSQEIDNVPVQEFDEKMDGILTEKGFFKVEK